MGELYQIGLESPLRRGHIGLPGSRPYSAKNLPQRPLWEARGRAMIYAMTGNNYLKPLFSVLIFSFTLSSASAGGLDDLRGLSAGFDVQAPVPAAPVPKAPPARSSQDPVLNALSDAQWDAIFSRKETPSVPLLPQNKELFSDFTIRYIVKGRVSFDTEPPLLTSVTGKVFRIVKYPRWLREVGPKMICVEGYVKQREENDEIAVDELLHPNTLEDLTPSDAILDLQRDPVILSSDENGYTLGNVSWSMVHDDKGEIATDENGNLVTVWHDGVKVDTSKLEDIYFVKKTALKPLRYGDHGMLMFKFKPGGVTAPDGSTTQALVVSVDAYYTDPIKMVYSPIAALRGRYQVYYSVQTMERYSDVKFNYNEFKMSTDLVLVPYPLKLDREQKLRLLRNALNKASADNTGEMYSLFYNSCANSVLSLINGVLPKGKKVEDGWLPEIFYRVQVTLPGAMSGLLVKRGIAGEPEAEITKNNFKAYFPLQ